MLTLQARLHRVATTLAVVEWPVKMFLRNNDSVKRSPGQHIMFNTIALPVSIDETVVALPAPEKLPESTQNHVSNSAGLQLSQRCSQRQQDRIYARTDLCT